MDASCSFAPSSPLPQIKIAIKMRSVARASQVRVVRTAAGALLFATLCVSSATGFSVPHVGTGLHPRAARCPAVMSAQTSDNVDSGYGDKALKSAAFALGEGQIKWARRLCARARQEYTPYPPSPTFPVLPRPLRWACRVLPCGLLSLASGMLSGMLIRRPSVAPGTR